MVLTTTPLTKNERIQQLEEQVSHLEDRIILLERHSHTDHTIGLDVLAVIARAVKQEIAQALVPPVVPPAEAEIESTSEKQLEEEPPVTQAG